MYKETRPMLCEDGYSDDEVKTVQRYKKHQYLSARHSGSREKLLGAARIISAWPNHLSTTFSLWTLGMASLFVFVFVLYSNVAAFTMLSSKSPKPLFPTNIEEESPVSVFMHIIVINETDAHLRQHILNIQSFMDDFPNLQYNLVILYNDTMDPNNFTISHAGNEDFEDHNSLTNIEKNTSSKIKINKMLNIQHITLTNYLDNSPLFKYWRQLPRYIISFLLRALSIWEKGGIAFDPNILQPDFPAVKYINKLAEIMKIYGKLNSNNSSEGIEPKKTSFPTNKRLDNIRDIINEMENNSEDNLNIIQENLNEEENKAYNTVMKTHVKKYLNEKPIEIEKNNEKSISFRNKYAIIINPNVTNSFISSKVNDHKLNSEVNNLPYVENEIDNTKTSNIKQNMNKNSQLKLRKPKLSLDLNGLIIATDTPCHAFLGTLFSNSYHYFEDHSVTEFISRELSMFCNGLLSSCKDIDIIIL